MVAMAPARAVRAALRQGRGSDPVGRFLSTDFPVLRADMPAVQAWYFLRSERRELAGVVSGDRFVGVVHIDSFLDDSRA
jgi:CBS domain-containing protein